MRIAVDAMGGDYAPKEIVLGALEAVKRFEDVEIILAGQPEKVNAFLPKPLPKRIKVVACREVVEMGDSPVEAIKRKKDSSLRRIFEMTASGEADAAISAGNTGATVAAAAMLLRPLEGCKRPGIAATFPSQKGHTLLIDVGANITPRPWHLLQYGIMAQVFAREVMGIAQPSVGILNIGTEDEKGTELVKAARGLLAGHVAGFVGSVEGRDVFNGAVDVVVCDGFVGNVLLKGTEGLGAYLVSAFLDHIKEALGDASEESSAKLRSFSAKVDYTEYGGAPLLGVEKPAIISHGSSNAKAIASAIRVARDFGARHVNRLIVEALAEAEEPADKEGGE
jgi:glycerol-3-phosphate acyltransferase PlsX